MRGNQLSVRTTQGTAPVKSGKKNEARHQVKRHFGSKPDSGAEKSRAMTIHRKELLVSSRRHVPVSGCLSAVKVFK
jgi:hypothetical protein